MLPPFLCFLNTSVSFLPRNNMGKRRRRAGDEEPASASPETTVRPQPLVLLALLKSALDLSVWLQLRLVPRALLLSFARLPPRVPRPFAGARV
jgi:hypothetical protein